MNRVASGGGAVVAVLKKDVSDLRGAGVTPSARSTVTTSGRAVT